MQFVISRINDKILYMCLCSRTSYPTYAYILVSLFGILLDVSLMELFPSSIFPKNVLLTNGDIRCCGFIFASHGFIKIVKPMTRNIVIL